MGRTGCPVGVQMSSGAMLEERMLVAGWSCTTRHGMGRGRGPGKDEARYKTWARAALAVLDTAPPATKYLRPIPRSSNVCVVSGHSEAYQEPFSAFPLASSTRHVDRAERLARFRPGRERDGGVPRWGRRFTLCEWCSYSMSMSPQQLLPSTFPAVCFPHQRSP